MLGIAGEAQSLFFMNLDLVCDDKFRLRDVLGSQELLGACATRSGLAVVIPFDVGRHDVSSFACRPILLHRYAPDLDAHA